MYFKKLLSILFLLCISASSFAGGWSNAAVPTRIDIVRGQGFMVFGEFGNLNGACTNAGMVFIQITHPQYNQIYSSALAALSAGKKLQLYSSVCAPVGWYAIDSVTFLTVTDGAVNIMN